MLRIGFVVFSGVLTLLMVWFVAGNLRARNWGAAAFSAVLAVFFGILTGFILKLSPPQRPDLGNRAAAIAGNEPKSQDKPAPAGPAGPPSAPIEVQSASWVMVAAVVGGAFLLVAAANLLLSPFESAPRWLSYSVAGVLLLTAASLVLGARYSGRPLIVADANGIEECRKWLGRREVKARVSWSQVGSAKLIEQRERVSAKSSDTRRTGRFLQLSDRNGKELMTISQPWGSSASFEDLIDAIPLWSGVEVEEAVWR